MDIGYEELERRQALLEKESSEKIAKAMTESYRILTGLRYSEIELFLQLMERELKKDCYLSGLGFESPVPKI